MIHGLLSAIRQRWIGHDEALIAPEAAAEADRELAAWTAIQAANRVAWNTSTMTLRTIRDSLIGNRRWPGERERGSDDPSGEWR